MLHIFGNDLIKLDDHDFKICEGLMDNLTNFLDQVRDDHEQDRECIR